MNKSIDELPVPSEIYSALKTIEIARIWVVDGNQLVTISSDLWKDPGSWGLMLVDLAKHVANAYHEQGYDKNDVLNRIKKAFDVEWQYPTDEPNREDEVTS